MESPVSPTEIEPARLQLLEAALAHVAFDGWSPATVEAARRDLGWTADATKAAAPRGALDLAVSYHHLTETQFLKSLETTELDGLRYSEKVSRLVWMRLSISDREIARRSSALFSLPIHAGEGAGLVWSTADVIWRVLGDTSDDLNWYSKRVILSGVYGSALLFWLGEEGDSEATQAFIDRRIADVMQIEKIKAQARKNPATKHVAAGLDRLFAAVKAPQKHDDLPGRWE